MALDAGSVYATLGGKFDPKGFEQFGASMETSHKRMEASEKKIAASQARVSASTERMGREASKAADLYQDSAGRWRSASGQFATDAEKASAGITSFNKTVQTQTKKTASVLDQMAKGSKKSYEDTGKAVKIGLVGALAALGGVIAYSVKKAADFQQQLSTLGSVTGATGKQMGQLKKQALDAGAATKYSALQAAQAQTELAKGGLSVKQILGGGLKAALSLAAAGDLELADAASTTVNAMKLFNLQGGKSMQVADALATAANSTTADVKDFAIALDQSGSAAKTAGLSFPETITALETLANVGIKGSDAGTSLKTMLIQLASPTSKKAADLTKKLGIEIFDTQGKMKPLVQVSKELRDGFDGLTQKQRIQAATTLVGQDGFRALLGLYDAGPAKIAKLEQELGKQGSAADVAAAKQDNLKGKFENFTGSVETAGIQIGSHLLPKLEDLATKATAAVNAFTKGGGADRFAGGVIDGVEELAHVGVGAARVGGQVAGVLIDIGKALDLGDPHKLEAIAAGFAAFKVAGVVAPMVAALAAGVRDLALNAATAPTLLAFLRDLPIGPVAAISLAIAGIAGAIVLLKTKESEEAQIARDSAKAHQEQAESMKAVQDAELAAADKGLAAKQATLDYKKAVQDFNEVRKKSKKGSDEYKDAELQVQQTFLRSTAAQDAYKKSIQSQQATVQKAVDKSRKSLQDAQADVDRLQKRLTPGPPAAGGIGSRIGATTGAANKDDIRALAEAQRALSAANTDYIATLGRAAVSETNRRRLMEQSKAITAENTQGVASLIKNLKDVPTERQTKLLVDDQDALAEAGGLAQQLDAIGKKNTVARILTTAPSAAAAVLGLRAALVNIPASTITKINTTAPSAGAAVVAFRAILAGVPAKKVVAILHNAGSAKTAVDQLRASIDALHNKSVTLTTVEQVIRTDRVKGGGHFASGRGAGQTNERALVGEGKGPEWVVDPAGGTATKVTGPTFMDLGPTAYVLPTDPMFRGRAAGWLTDIARDLGIPGYKSGKKPSKRFVPAHLDPIAYDVDDFTNRADNTHDAIDKSKQIAKNLANAKTQLRRAERMPSKTAKQKAARQDSIGQANRRIKGYRDDLNALPEHGDLAKLRADWTERKRELAKAKAYQHQIDAAQKDADNFADAMALADRRNDGTAYESARSGRQTALGKLRKLIADALGLSKTAGNTDRVQDLTGQLGKIDLDIDDNQSAVQQAVDDLASTGMTAAERAVLANINKGISLAALTDGLGDDTAAAQSKVNFLTGILNDALVNPARGGDATIADLADQLGTAKSNLASLTGGGTNDNPDLQAQIDQANARTTAANTDAEISRQALAAFQGWSGPGGPGAGTVINVNTLHPGDPAVWTAVAQATNAGNDLAPTRRPLTVKVGL